MSDDGSGSGSGSDEEPPLTNAEVAQRTGASLAEVQEYVAMLSWCFLWTRTSLLNQSPTHARHSLLRHSLAPSLPQSLSLSLLPPSRYREIFQLVDLDGGGSIDGEELGELMDLLGMNATKEEVNTMLNEIDSTGTGEVYFQDFVAEMSKKVDCDYTAPEVIKAFKKFAGPDSHGMIHSSALEKTLTSFEGKLPREEAQDLVAQVPQDKAGMINYVEYVNMMMSDQRGRAPEGKAAADGEGGSGGGDGGGEEKI